MLWILGWFSIFPVCQQGKNIIFITQMLSWDKCQFFSWTSLMLQAILLYSILIL
jgi:hypothetical protein